MSAATYSAIRVLWVGVLALSAGTLPKQLLAQRVKKNLETAHDAYSAGKSALTRRDLEAAQSDFAQVVRLNPEEERGYSALGAVLASRGHINEAIPVLQRALDLQPNDRVVQLNLALALVQDGSPQQALPLFEALDARAKRHRQALPPSVVIAYARALAQLHQIDRAELAIGAALAGDSSSAELHDELGSLYGQRSQWTDAQHEFSTAVHLSPGDALAHMHLGLAMRAQHQAHGIDQLVTAMHLAPEDPLIALELGNAYAADGQDTKAIPILRRALSLTPTSTDAAYQLAIALQRTNDAGDAIPLFKQVIAAEPGNSVALTNLGLALCQTGDPQAAVPIIARSVSADPSNVVAREDLAVAYVQLSQFDDAVSELTAALKIAPDQPQLHYDLGVAYKWQDKVTPAITEIEAAERLNPASPDPPYLLGYLYMQEGHYSEAARAMRLALTLRRNDSDGWATLGAVYENLSDFPQAEYALREAIHQDPTQAGPHLTLASVLVKQHKLQEAREERLKAANLMRTVLNHKQAEVSTHAGEAKLRVGDIAGAASDFQNAISYDPKFAEARLDLAKALDRQGKTLEAAAQRQKAELPAQVSATSSSP